MVWPFKKREPQGSQEAVWAGRLAQDGLDRAEELKTRATAVSTDLQATLARNHFAASLISTIQGDVK